MIGAHEEDGKGTDAGAAYIFERSGIVWSQKDQMRASDGAAGDAMGSAVAISGSTVILGAPGHYPASNRIGKVHVFTRKLIARPAVYDWVRQTKLGASDGVAKDGFGSGVDIDGDRAVVGAQWSNAMGTTSGCAYTYNRSGTTWTERYKVVASDGEVNDQLGASVAIAKGVIADRVRRSMTVTFTDCGGVYTRSANVSPYASADSYTIEAGVKRTVAKPGVMGNDFDSDGNAFTAVEDG